MRYLISIGTKAEFIKMFPIMLELQSRNIEYLFVATGQHDLSELAKTFKTKYPDIILNPKNGFKGDTGGAFGWGFKTLPKLIKYFREHKDVKFVITHGDTISTAISAVAGVLTGKKVVHVEAGLRSGSFFEPFPEELVRVFVDWFSHIKFAVSEKTKKRLSGEVFNVGNTSIDSLTYALYNGPMSKLKQPYAVCTIHRHENIKSKERMERIISILSYCQIPLYFFIHENTVKQLKEHGLYNELENNKNIKLMKPVSYINFASILARSHMIITDGGSMSEEAAQLNVPCIILRKATEREELLERGDQVLTNLSEQLGKEAIMLYSLPRVPYFLPNVYNGKNTSAKIIDTLEGMH